MACSLCWLSCFNVSCVWPRNKRRTEAWTSLVIRGFSPMLDNNALLDFSRILEKKILLFKKRKKRKRFYISTKKVCFSPKRGRWLSTLFFPRLQCGSFRLMDRRCDASLFREIIERQWTVQSKRCVRFKQLPSGWWLKLFPRKASGSWSCASSIMHGQDKDCTGGFQRHGAVTQSRPIQL